jgi:hypothetical protein
MSHDLPHRGVPDPRRRWDRFLAVALCSRSAQEMLAAVLHRPVLAHPFRNTVLRVDGPVTPLQLAAGRHSLRVLDHLLIDSRPPYRPLGLCSAVVVDERLPPSIAGGVRRGDAPLDALLERAGAYWTADTRDVHTLLPPELVHFTRLLYALCTPVAAVAEEIPLSVLCRAAGDPHPTTALDESWVEFATGEERHGPAA